LFSSLSIIFTRLPQTALFAAQQFEDELGQRENRFCCHGEASRTLVALLMLVDSALDAGDSPEFPSPSKALV
jgi:hypothetical protein